MQKKLIAVAVAGVLGAPVMALAQTSTVNIYGRVTYEYAIVDQGRGMPNTDYADNPGGSAIGFRGEEKLGGGLSAWFQCENSIDVRGIDAAQGANQGWCSRNSAVGFKGAWGNLHFGRWDTPFKRMLAPGSVGGIVETGSLGTSFVAWGGSGGTNATLASNRVRWKRRDVGLTYYETPVFSGFQGLFAFSPGNGAIDNGAVDGDANMRPRVWSFGGTYMAGPLGIGIGYEKHSQFGMGAAPAPGTNLDDRAWGISAGYTFAGRVRIGGTYLDSRYETLPLGATTKRKSWTAGVEWNVAGPHTLKAFYGKAGDSKGSGTGIGGGSSGSIPAPGPDTGANDWSIGYQYAFSKRTAVQIGYHRTDNDRNAFYKVGTANTPLGPLGGEKQDAYGFHISHSF
jgi:predicted porin